MTDILKILVCALPISLIIVGFIYWRIETFMKPFNYMACYIDECTMGNVKKQKMLRKGRRN